MSSPFIVSTNISSCKGDKKKSPVKEIILNAMGISGDIHAGYGNRQVSILGEESFDGFFARTGKKVYPGDFAENLTIRGIDLTKVALLGRLIIGDSVVLEIAKLGKKCYGDVCSIFQEFGPCAMSKEGVFARVINGGAIKALDPIKYLPRPLQVLIVTLSDRAFNGIYEDKSGPLARQLIEKFFTDKRWHLQITSELLPDDAGLLAGLLEKTITANVDIVITVGSTGIGPRDIAPDVVGKICDKFIPGVMENIRIKYAVNKPAALLSRGMVGIKNTTQVYTLPGSARAVEEYLTEIFKTLEHTLYMLHGVDAH